MTIFDTTKLSSTSADPKIIVSLKADDQMDKGLIEFVNSIPVKSASERNQLLGQLRNNNVFTKSQLASLRPDQVSQLSPAVQSSIKQESNAQQVNFALTPEAKAARLEALDPSNFADLAAAKALRTKLLDEAKEATKTGNARVTKAADDMTVSLKGSIDALENLGGVDFKTSQMLTDLKKAIESGGHVGGTPWTIDDLIRRNGLLRGVTLRGSISQTLHKEVVQFTSDFRNRAPDDDVKKRVLTMNPDVLAKEVSLQATDASSLQSSDRLMETFGLSSYKSKSWQFFLGLGSPSFGGVGFSIGGSNNAGESNNADSQSTEQLSETTKSVSKSNYYFEPRTIIAVPSEDLEPTPAFVQALWKTFGRFFDGTSPEGTILDEDAPITATAAQLAAPATVLFEKFGTHVCHRAMLGGWWRITASLQSTKAIRNVDAQRIVSKSIERARTFSVGASGSGAAPVGAAAPGAGAAEGDGASPNSVGGSAGGGSGSSQLFNQGEGVGWKDMQSLADEDTVMDVKQVWRGGSSGTTPAEWRRSLDESKSSNWQVIDRYADHCTGVWRWVPNRALRTGICHEWALQVVAELDPDGTLLGPGTDVLIDASCSGSGDLRETLLVLAADQMKEARDQVRQECEGRTGYHYDSTKHLCELNFCKCGDSLISGEQCVTHGAMACPDDMRAQCRELTCPSGYHLNPERTTALCQLDVCDVQRDKETCCKDNMLAQSLKIKFRMGSQGTNKLYVQFMTQDKIVRIVSGPGQAFAQPINGNTGWWEYQDDSPADLSKNKDSEVTATLAEPIQFPARICLAVHTSAGMWGDEMTMQQDTPVTVTSTEAPSADNILGYATGFTKFDADARDGPDFQCKYVQRRGR